MKYIFYYIIIILLYINIFNIFSNSNTLHEVDVTPNDIDMNIINNNNIKNSKYKLCLLVILRDESANIKKNIKLWSKYVDYMIIGIDSRTTDDSVIQIYNQLNDFNQDNFFIFYFQFNGFGDARTKTINQAYKQYPDSTHFIIADIDWDINNSYIDLNELDMEHELFYFNIWNRESVSKVSPWLIKNIPNIKMENYIHEVISLPIDNELIKKKKISWVFKENTDEKTWHDSENHGSNISFERFISDIDLLYKDYNKDPNNVRTLYYLGITSIAALEAECYTNECINKKNDPYLLQSLYYNGTYYLKKRLELIGLNSNLIYNKIIFPINTIINKDELILNNNKLRKNQMTLPISSFDLNNITNNLIINENDNIEQIWSTIFWLGYSYDILGYNIIKITEDNLINNINNNNDNNKIKELKINLNNILNEDIYNYSPVPFYQLCHYIDPLRDDCSIFLGKYYLDNKEYDLSFQYMIEALSIPFQERTIGRNHELSNCFLHYYFSKLIINIIKNNHQLPLSLTDIKKDDLFLLGWSYWNLAKKECKLPGGSTANININNINEYINNNQMNVKLETNDNINELKNDWNKYINIYNYSLDIEPCHIKNNKPSIKPYKLSNIFGHLYILNHPCHNILINEINNNNNNNNNIIYDDEKIQNLFNIIQINGYTDTIEYAYKNDAIHLLSPLFEFITKHTERCFPGPSYHSTFPLKDTIYKFGDTPICRVLYPINIDRLKAGSGMNYTRINKLNHDIEQFQYLANNGILSDFINNELINLYKLVKNDIYNNRIDDDDNIINFTVEQYELIKNFYNKRLYIPKETLYSLENNNNNNNNILNNNINWNEAEIIYYNSTPPVVIIDNVLNKDSLNILKKILLESTIYYETKNSNIGGYVGAYINDGLNQNIFFKLGIELQDKLKNIYLNKHFLRYIWAYKYEQSKKGIGIHADDAAVNANIWLTNNDACDDFDNSGLIIYNVKAPKNLSSIEMNSKNDLIHNLLKENNYEHIKIPYKENRMVIFDSSYFHRTADYKFKNGYKNKRINLTYLAGHR